MDEALPSAASEDWANAIRWLRSLGIDELVAEDIVYEGISIGEVVRLIKAGATVEQAMRIAR